MQKRELRAVMDVLVNMPCGGIGSDGATMAELEEAAGRGRAFLDDAEYHQTQWAWRMLEALLPQCRKDKV